MGLPGLWRSMTHHPYKALGGLLGLAITVWLLFSIFLYLVSPMIIFNTKASIGVEPGVPFTQLWLNDAENRKIDTVWIQNSQSSKVVLYLHGNRGRLPPFFAPLAQKFNILAPAYPGYHQSEGKPSTKNIYSTALLAYDYLLQQGYQDDQIIVFGHSMGGSPAVYTGTQRPAAGKIVIVNTFNSMYDMCVPQYSIGCIFIKNVLDTAKYAPSVHNKVRQFHDKNDTVVPYSQGKKLYSHFTGTQDKKFITLPETDSHSEFDVVGVVSTD